MWNCCLVQRQSYFSTNLLEKVYLFLGKRAMIIHKNLNIFYVVSPNFDPLAHEEMQSVGRYKGE